MYDTIIIGLGASGASAASTLARAGKRVLVLEAQNRVGGRVCTVPFGDGVVELGAEWIHGQHPSSVYDLAMQNNVSIISQDTTLDVYTSDGSKGDAMLVNELVEFALQACEQPPEKPQPLGQYITCRLMDYIKTNHSDLLKDQDYISDLLTFLDLVVDSYEATTSWDDVTTQSQYRELEGDQHLSWHRNGYKTLFEILLNTYNNGPGLSTLEYKLNKEVTQINWSTEPNNKVTVVCKDGDQYTADNVIVTLSIGVLKQRHANLFSPKLPQSKIKCIDTIAIGVMNKITLLFPFSWWPKDSTFFGFFWRKSEKKDVPEGDRWTTQIFGCTTPFGSKNTLTLWTCGDAGRTIETLPDDVVKRKCMELLRRFFGTNGTIPEPVDMIRSSWHSNPYTLGSYTYDHVDSHLHPTARIDLQQPITDDNGTPKILFAGEATDPNHFSTVHGAFDSGRREAMRLLPKSKIHANLFSPKLPQSKIKCIDTIAIGVMNKITLLFPFSWWPKDSTFFGFFWRKSEKKDVPEGDRWTTQIFGCTTPFGSKNTLTLWTCGDAGRTIETLPDDVVKRKCMELLRRFFGTNGTIPEPVDMIRSSWHSNPYTLGSYTYDHVDSHLHPTARIDLQQPITDDNGTPKILFAGEATDPNHFSTVHGAFDSGRREAMRLLPKSKM